MDNFKTGNCGAYAPASASFHGSILMAKTMSIHAEQTEQELKQSKLQACCHSFSFTAKAWRATDAAFADTTSVELAGRAERATIAKPEAMSPWAYGKAKRW